MTDASGAGRRWIAATLFVLVWLSVAWFGSWERNPNHAVRLFAAIAIVEEGTAVIDRYAPLTIDKAQFDGHSYSDKAPGMTLMALAPVALANAWTGERGQDFVWLDGNPAFDRFLRLRLRLAVAMGPALLTALATVLLWDMALALTGSAGAALFAALGFALGTPAWGWSTTLFGHAAVAALLFVAFWTIWRGTRDGARRPRVLAAVAGVSLGWALVVEHSAVLTAAPLGLWALWRLARTPAPARWRLAGVAIAGGVAALLPLLGYNLFAYGTPFRIAYSGVQGFEGMREGLFGLTYPKPEVLGELLVGRLRGLFWVAPVLALAPFGFVAMLWRREWREPGLVALAVAAAALLVNAAYVYWDGGNGTGPRHSVPALPFLALALAPLWAWARLAWLRVLAALLLAISIAANLAIASAEIMAPAWIPDAMRDAVLRDRFWRGELRTWPSEWWSWTPWEGLALYLVPACILLISLVFQARAADRHRQPG